MTGSLLISNGFVSGLRFKRLSAAAILGLSLTVAIPLHAQIVTKQDGVEAKKDTLAPVPRVSTAAAIDALFGRLAKAQDAVEAKGIADQIERFWSKSGSDTADLLMSRVNQSIKAQNYDLALDLLDSLITLEPQWAEAWNRRATVHYLREDVDSSMRDIRQVLALEPRHYGAIAGMSLIFQVLEDKKRAYKAAKAALAIYPFMDGAKGYVERYAREVEGEDL